MNTNCSSYNDFLGEAIAESYRTNKLSRPNTNGKLHKARSAFRTKIENEANQQGRDISDVALDYVNENSGQIQKYILSKGEVPQDWNAQQLAIQAFELRKAEVESIAQALGSDLATAEAYLDDAENNAMEINSPESDSFIGELFDAIAHAASPGLQKAVDKRKAAGKKPGVAGFFNNLLSASDTQSGLTNAGAVAEGVGDGIAKGSGVKDILSSVIDSVKENEKKKEIKKMLPQIIIGVALLIIVVVVITKSFNKK